MARLIFNMALKQHYNMTDSCISCYHCGLPVPDNSDFFLVIENQSRAMCCPGCAAVAATITGSGLGIFYNFRTEQLKQPAPEKAQFKDWDIPALQNDYVSLDTQGPSQQVVRRIRVHIGNISCAACVWLIEKQLEKLPGIEQVLVNGTTHRGEIAWNPEQLKLSQILSAMADIGYLVTPINNESQLPDIKQQTRTMLMRLGVAGLAMMQTTMLAIALYAGALQGIEAQWQHLLRIVSVILVTPVVFYSAQPFFINAWRSLRLGHLVMDVPVALAIGLAYSASLWATWQQSGDVYFDSVAMFTFFLLLGRFAEQRIRYRNLLSVHGQDGLLPPAATKITRAKGPNRFKTVPIKTLKLGDLIYVEAGQTIPCDGTIKKGISQISEAVLTGESRAVRKQVGQTVCAGTINGANPLIIKVSAFGRDTRLSNILELAERAALEKPPWVGVADRVAGWFVGAVLVIASLVGLFWTFYDPSRALWIMLSVLVVTCPCALSLATPTVMALANGILRRQGFLINRGHVLEQLSNVDQVIFDKTGTLTEGNLLLTKVIPAAILHSRLKEVVNWAASLEQGSQHPIARALKKSGLVPVTDQEFITGNGVLGKLANDKGVLQEFAFGSPGWVAEVMGLPPQPHLTAEYGIQVAIARKRPWRGEERSEWIASLIFDDQLRPAAEPAVQQLNEQGMQVHLLSGDPSSAAADIVHHLPLHSTAFGLQPEHKLAALKRLQEQGHQVLMVGDGINDIPVLQAANISVAMGAASELSHISADAILLNNDLEMLPRAIALAHRARHIIRQNIGWAIGYNALALPLAAMGYVPPWAAAIGMSASSLLVLLNSLRLKKTSTTSVISSPAVPRVAHV
jgi:Cu2+-exporting ATPase